MQANSIEKVLESNAPSIASLFKKFGEDKGRMAARAVIFILITDMLDDFNLKTCMSDRQIARAADAIIEDFYYLKPDDIKLCFKNAVKLKYGEIYNRIDVSIIYGWIHQYVKDRATVTEDISINEAKRIKYEQSGEIIGGVSYEEYRRQLKEKADGGDEDAKKFLEVSDNNRKTLYKKKSAY